MVTRNNYDSESVNVTCIWMKNKFRDYFYQTHKKFTLSMCEKKNPKIYFYLNIIVCLLLYTFHIYPPSPTVNSIIIISLMSLYSNKKKKVTYIIN